MKIIDRLDKYMAVAGINDNQMTVNAGLSIGLLNNARRGNYDIGKKSIDKILSFYQDLNKVWLLTGEGEMLKTAHEVRPDHTFPLRTDRAVADHNIPLYELTATAGLVAIFNQMVAEPVDYLRVPNLPPVDGAVYVRGDSMSPLLKSGDIIIFKKTELSPEGILWGQIYLLSYIIGGDTYTVVKYVKRSPLGDGHIRLVSANEFYDPVDVPDGSVTALALVKASITFYTME